MNSLNSTSDAVVDHVGLYMIHYHIFMHLTLSLEQTSMTEFEPEEQLALYPLLYFKSIFCHLLYFCSCGDKTQGITHGRRVISTLSHICSLESY